jgi:hypothetical protein
MLRLRELQMMTKLEEVLENDKITGKEGCDTLEGGDEKTRYKVKRNLIIKREAGS